MSEEIAPEPEIADINEVKQLVGNLGPRSGWTDNRYNSIINRWEGYVKTVTGKFDWQTTDEDYPAIRGIVENLAAANILWIQDPNSKIAKTLYDSSIKGLEAFMASSEVAGQPKSGGINIAKPLESWPTNPNSIPYTSIRKNKPTAWNGYLYPWRD